MFQHREIRVIGFWLLFYQVFGVGQGRGFADHGIALHVLQRGFDVLNEFGIAYILAVRYRLALEPFEYLDLEQAKGCLLNHIVAPQLERHQCNLRLCH